MRHTYNTIILLFFMTATLLSCSTTRKASQDTQANEVAEVANEAETPAGIATELEYEIAIEEMECDSCLFDVPEAMAENTDSLLNTWQARTLLKKLDCNTTGWEKIGRAHV